MECVEGLPRDVAHVWSCLMQKNFLHNLFKRKPDSSSYLNIYFFKTPLQVALRDMQMRGMPSNLLPGEPLCSPRTTVLLESTVQLLRRLHQCDNWSSHINQHVLSHLELIGVLLREDDSGSFKDSGRRYAFVTVACLTCCFECFVTKTDCDWGFKLGMLHRCPFFHFRYWYLSIVDTDPIPI